MVCCMYSQHVTLSISLFKLQYTYQRHDIAVCAENAIKPQSIYQSIDPLPRRSINAGHSRRYTLLLQNDELPERVLGGVLKKALASTYKSFASVSSRPDQLSLTVLSTVCQKWRRTLLSQDRVTTRNLFRRKQPQLYYFQHPKLFSSLVSQLLTYLIK